MDEKKHAAGNLRYIRGRIVMRVPIRGGPELPGAEGHVITSCLSVYRPGAGGTAPGTRREGCSGQHPSEPLRYGMKPACPVFWPPERAFAAFPA